MHTRPRRSPLLINSTMDDFSGIVHGTAAMLPVTGTPSASPSHPVMHHPAWGIPLDTPWLAHAVSDTTSIIEFRTPAECCIAGVHTTVDISIIALAIPVAHDVYGAVGFDVDPARLPRRPDGPLNPAVLDSPESTCMKPHLAPQSPQADVLGSARTYGDTRVSGV